MASQHHPTPEFLIIGGTGKTGRRVAQRLTAAGRSVRIASRTSSTRFDWDDESTWSPALDGVRAAYVTFAPDLSVPGTAARIAALGEQARVQGLERVVLLSGRGEPEAQAAEQAMFDSGIDTTVVRCSFFAQNFSEDFLVETVLDGVIALPAGDVAEPIVDADDVAAVAVAALTEHIETGRVYELTGPRLLTFATVAEILSNATGRPITYVDVPVAEYAARAIEAGVPAPDAAMLADLFAHIFDGHNASTASGVFEALGRPAIDFADYAARAAAGGAWDLGAGDGAVA